jgi:hypothetical protein
LADRYRDGLKNQQVIDAVEKALREGTWITIEQ